MIRLGRPFALVVLCLASVIAAEASAVDAYKLAHGQYFEGVPLSEAQKLDDAGVTQLAAWLQDPAEKANHATIVSLLGMSGRASAAPVLGAYADAVPRGEVDDDTYRARYALPLALGHLSRTQPSLLARLISAARSPATSAPWHTQRIDAARMAGMLRRRAVSGLAVSGSSAALAQIESMLSKAQKESPPDGEWIRHLQDSRTLCERVKAAGAAAVFGDLR